MSVVVWLYIDCPKMSCLPACPSWKKCHMDKGSERKMKADRCFGKWFGKFNRCVGCLHENECREAMGDTGI